MLLITKAISKEKKWVYGYPIKNKSNEIQFFDECANIISVYEESICYSIDTLDKNGTPLFIGDIVNDFMGGVGIPDTEHPDYDPRQAFPPMKTIGDTTRLGTLILEEGTIRVETIALSYSYNISHPGLSNCEFVGNTYDYLLK